MARVLENVWLCVALISLGSGIYTSIKDGIDEAYLFYFITFIAAIFYAVRRKQRLDREGETE